MDCLPSLSKLASRLPSPFSRATAKSQPVASPWYEKPATTSLPSADGKLVVAGFSYQGEATGWDFAVARLNGDGSLDASFDSDGKQSIDFGSHGDFAYSVAVQSDGKLVVAGYSHQGDTGYDFAVARLLGGNHPPTATDDGYSTFEDASVSGNVLDNDSDALAAELISGPSHGKLVFSADGTF